MSTVNQIYSIMNSLNAQANKGDTVAVTDTRSFISYGESISSLSDANKETWFTTLVDRIASTIIDNRAYRRKADGLWREPFEYAACLQKLHAKMPAVGSDPAFLSPSDLSSTNPFAPTVREIEQRLYNKISAFCISDTIPDVQLKTAFLDEAKMAAFLDALMMTAQNAFERSVENLSNACRSALAATAIHEEGAHYVNLLGLWMATLADDDPRLLMDDASDALTDRDFLRFASMFIAKTMKQMQTMTTVFSASGYERWTPESYMCCAILNDFEQAVNSFLAADTYHEELVKLPEENRIILPYWQGSGSGFAFGDTSSIKLKIPRTTGTDEQIAAGYTIQKTGVIAMIYDTEAAGITIDERRTRALYNPKDEFTNYWHKGREQYYIDATHPHVVFTMEIPQT